MEAWFCLMLHVAFIYFPSHHLGLSSLGVLIITCRFLDSSIPTEITFLWNSQRNYKSVDFSLYLRTTFVLKACVFF